MEQKIVKIFDLDGALADIEPFHLTAFNILFNRHKFNIHLDDKEWSKYIGNKEEVIFRMIFTDYGVDKSLFNIFELKEERINIFLNVLDYVYLRRFEDVCKEAEESQGHHFILSSQSRNVIDKLLHNIKLDNCFKKEEILCSPEICLYKEEILIAANLFFKDDIDNCELFESLPDILAMAHDIGYRTAGVVSKSNLKNFNYSVCDRIFNETRN